MSTSAPTTILCIASYFKGEDFIRECRRQGCRVLLVTVEALADEPWPRESLDEVFYMPDFNAREDVLHGISYLARTERIDRIVALDEFDLEIASALREHLRVPGMGETTVRYFRDKLAMRQKAREEGIPVPDFVAILNYDALRDFLDRVPPPWVLKPRTSASSIGIRMLSEPEALWRALDVLGDEQSFHLLERFVPGQVLHVDAVVRDREVVFAEVHRYARPPFEVYHDGGMFCTRTVRRGSAEEEEARELNRRVVDAMGLVRGTLHTEFIRGDDGRLYFLETAARVGGAHIAETVEAATGVNLWAEWARVEVADARREPYTPPRARGDYAGVVISLARQEWPDTVAYDDPEIVWRMTKHHHAGLIVASSSPGRVEELTESYQRRFLDDFHASLPAPAKASELGPLG